MVPVGGAGLIAGVSCAVKTLKPDVNVSFTLSFKNLFHAIRYHPL